MLLTNEYFGRNRNAVTTNFLYNIDCGELCLIFVLYLEEGVHCTSLELSQYFADN